MPDPNPRETYIGSHLDSAIGPCDGCGRTRIRAPIVDHGDGSIFLFCLPCAGGPRARLTLIAGGIAPPPSPRPGGEEVRPMPNPARYTNQECDPGDAGATLDEIRACNADDPPEDLYALLGALPVGGSLDYNAGAGGIFTWRRVS